MARGSQGKGRDVVAMEMTKWFDTNYHYLVPELPAGQRFSLSSTKPVDELREARALGINAKPVLIGPVTFLPSRRPPGWATVSATSRRSCPSMPKSSAN
jgi:5-methyltetrahydropteroyltriglutamate--homocysteine methyltransferase